MADGPDARRAPRISRSVPLELTGLGKTVSARSAVINTHGFLGLSSGRWPQGAVVRVVNERNGLAAEGVIVWEGVGDRGQHFKYGIEFTHAADDFWGTDYPAGAIRETLTDFAVKARALRATSASETVAAELAS